MPVVTIFPKSREVEDKLAEIMETLRPQIKEIICRISGFPEHDVVVDLNICLKRDADPVGADIELKVETCPHVALEARSNELCLALGQLFIDQGLTVGMTLESWIQFLPGPWCQIKDGQITDSVSHPREGEKATS